MKKYIVETYYTCTFKTVHSLDKIDDAELSNIDKRTDGNVEVLDVKLNNRKTEKLVALKTKNQKKQSSIILCLITFRNKLKVFKTKTQKI